jgi:dTDP-4-dehydrorhamnose reductase
MVRLRTRSIVKQAGINCSIEPIPTAALNLPAPRPAYSVLDCSAIRNDYSISIPWWQDALDEYLNQQLLNPTE